MINLQKVYEGTFSFVILLLVFGLTFPYGLPIYTPLVFLFFIIALINNKVRLKINVSIILFLLTICSYVWGMVLNQGVLYTNNISDITNIVMLLLLFLSITNLDNKEYKRMKRKAHVLITISSISVSIFSLYKFYLLLNNQRLDFLYNGSYYPVGTSLMSDYNMYSLGMLIGLISITYLIINSDSLKVGYLLMYSYLPVILAVFFSSSRRGLLMLIVLVILIIVQLMRKSEILKSFRNKLLFLSIAGTTTIIALFFSENINIQITNTLFLENVLNRSLGVADITNTVSSRTIRWDYSIKLIEDFTIPQAIFGNGFKYLDFLGNIFKPGFEEYPHNFFLSTLLYSGILGLVIIVFLLLSVIVRGLINFKQIGVDMNLMFIIGLIFMLVSGNSIFSSKVLGVLILIIICAPIDKNKIEKYDIKLNALSVESGK